MDIPIDHQPVTAADFRPVFRVLSVVDGHPRGADDVEGWMLAATSGRWTRAQLAAGTIALTSAWTGFRIQPGHLAERITALRAQVRSRWSCPPPPRELRDDPAAESVWRRRAAVDFADRAMLALAAGRPLADVPLVPSGSDDTPAALPAGQARLRELIDNAFVAISPADDPTSAAVAVERRTALTRPCSFCGSRRGEPCTRPGRTGRVPMRTVHPARADSTPADLREDATA